MSHVQAKKPMWLIICGLVAPGAINEIEMCDVLSLVETCRDLFSLQ